MHVSDAHIPLTISRKHISMHECETEFMQRLDMIYIMQEKMDKETQKLREKRLLEQELRDKESWEKELHKKELALRERELIMGRR
jgi:hypothetical protein